MGYFDRKIVLFLSQNTEAVGKPPEVPQCLIAFCWRDDRFLQRSTDIFEKGYPVQSGRTKTQIDSCVRGDSRE